MRDENSCGGRYTLKTSIDELVEFFQLPASFTFFEPRYNIAPTQPVTGHSRSYDRRRGEFSAETPAGIFHMGTRAILEQAPRRRRETAERAQRNAGGKALVRTAFKRHRCIIPADGFMNGRHGQKKARLPHSPAPPKSLRLAGLFEEWHGPNGEVLESCAIVTTTENELMRPIHDRMPVI